MLFLYPAFWNVRGECENYMLLSGHKNVVTELNWTADGTYVECTVGGEDMCAGVGAGRERCCPGQMAFGNFAAPMLLVDALVW